MLCEYELFHESIVGEKPEYKAVSSNEKIVNYTMH